MVMWPILIFLLSAILGVAISTRKFIPRYLDAQRIEAIKERQSYVVSAWNRARTAFLLIIVHVLFFLSGTDALLTLTPVGTRVILDYGLFIIALYLLVALLYFEDISDRKADNLARKGQ